MSIVACSSPLNSSFLGSQFSSRPSISVMFAKWQEVMVRWCVSTSEIGTSSAFDALEEVLHVTGRLLTVVELDDLLFELGFIGFAHVLHRLAGEPFAIDEDATLVAREQDAIGELRFAVVRFVLIAQWSVEPSAYSRLTLNWSACG